MHSTQRAHQHAQNQHLHEAAVHGGLVDLRSDLYGHKSEISLCTADVGHNRQHQVGTLS